MSWFFGKKKHHKSSSSDSPVEENTVPLQGDDFIFVENQGNPLPPNSDIGNESGPPSSNLYPNLSGMSLYPSTVPTDLPKQNPQTDLHSYLYGVPFKLCKQLEISTNNDIDIDRLRVNEILSFIVRTENDDFKYDFSLERSVVNEMDSRNE